MRVSRQLMASILFAPLFIAACGGTSSPAASSHSPMPSGEEAMMMQPGAENMKVNILSPADGSVVTGNILALQIQTLGFTDTCNGAGSKDVAGFGHYHIELDKSLVNMYCTSAAALVSMQNVKPGTHTFTVIPAQNDHAEIHANAKSITVDYEPTNPLPAIADATFGGPKSIKILSPAAGSDLNGAFDVTVQVTNFNLSCDLYGKPDVAGYGHWHLNLDSDTGAMMGMGTMVGMVCTKTFHANTTGMTPGKHTLIALLVDNGHVPFNPDVNAKIDVTVG
jgi:hypothetical protein